MQGKRIVRKSADRMVGGVASGLGAYFNIDPVFVRIGFVVLALFQGFGALLYLILWILLPSENSTAPDTRSQIQENLHELQETAEQWIERARSMFQRQI